MSEISLHSKNTAKSTTRNRPRVKFSPFGKCFVILRARICCVRLRWNYLNVLNKLSKAVFTNLKLWRFSLHFERDLHSSSFSTENEILCVVQPRVKVAGKRSRRFRTIRGWTNQTADEVHKKQTYQCISGMNFFFKLSIVARPLRPRRNFLVDDKQVFLSDLTYAWILRWMTRISGANYFGCSLIYVWPFRGNTGQDRMWALFIGCFDSNFKQEYLVVFHLAVKSTSLSNA